MNLALIGASGLLGRAVAAALAPRREWRLVATVRDPHGAPARAAARLAGLGPDALTPLDVLDARALDRFFAEHRPDAVIVCAAERRPDVCEHEPGAARAINVEALAALAARADALGAWTLAMSTDYVFDGRAAPYRETDPPAPLNAYGRSKADGEAALLDASARACVLRLPLLYGPVFGWGDSAVTSLVPPVVASAQPGAAAADMDAWAIRYPTWTPDVAYVITQLVARHAAGEAVTGRCHWSGDEPMTKHEIATRIGRALGLRPRLNAIAEPRDATPRPYDCHLDSTRLEALGIGRRTRFDAAIREVLRDGPAI
ncbi:dTDP-4-dehydrorhamnose reductase family protein [Burkholderia glumae]|uniref:dTDP-4-dehydrorhamnose reductase family protein n=1 Tax=Burkholderia glumae TaxID=337 RepID=UPI000C2755FB|nr:SDR family oxidoreductase [Burkholderia glumae]PJO22809.1 NAD(P)-dependent oxidoreductase [Burkholderia glumae AU6208]QHE12352.1 sugar nucleotide-binding protein [Burkholderia glumae AU6208]